MLSSGQGAAVLIVFGLVAVFALGVLFFLSRFAPTVLGGIVVAALALLLVVFGYRQSVHAYRVYTVNATCDRYAFKVRHSPDQVDLSRIALERRGQDVISLIETLNPLVPGLFTSLPALQQIELRYRPRDPGRHQSKLLATGKPPRAWLVDRSAPLTEEALSIPTRHFPEVASTASIVLTAERVAPAPNERSQRIDSVWRWALLDASTRAVLIEHRTPFFRFGEQEFGCYEDYLLPRGRRGGAGRNWSVDAHQSGVASILREIARP
jgi:hypothetical protein